MDLLQDNPPMKRLIAATLAFSLAGSSSPVRAGDFDINNLVCIDSGKVCSDVSTKKETKKGVLIEGYVVPEEPAAEDIYAIRWEINCATETIRALAKKNLAPGTDRASKWQKLNNASAKHISSKDPIFYGACNDPD